MRLSKTEERVLNALQVGHTRESLVAELGGHPMYIARVLKKLVNAGLIDATPPKRQWTYLAKVKLELVNLDRTGEQAVQLVDNAQG